MSLRCIFIIENSHFSNPLYIRIDILFYLSTQIYRFVRLNDLENTGTCQQSILVRQNSEPWAESLGLD